MNLLDAYRSSMDKDVMCDTHGVKDCLLCALNSNRKSGAPPSMHVNTYNGAVMQPSQSPYGGYPVNETKPNDSNSNTKITLNNSNSNSNINNANTFSTVGTDSNLRVSLGSVTGYTISSGPMVGELLHL